MSRHHKSLSDLFYPNIPFRTDNSVKHMKIYQKIEDGQTHYFLSTRRYFRTIVDLVSYYERNDLGENFAG